MTSFRESRSPAVPSRSPFRIRDSHLSRMTDNMGRWSFTSELDSLWNMKPKAVYNQTDTENDTMFSSSNLLVELLISQAILDSSEFKALSFDNLEALKKVGLKICYHPFNFAHFII
ncbi:hypothetical protein EDC96DRAFT_22176 [Choanephora cucurbitarum]|nr:hypothetical protein EDC96DRAFT_22176 [Choanephora cucurbitarum]